MCRLRAASSVVVDLASSRYSILRNSTWLLQSSREAPACSLQQDLHKRQQLPRTQCTSRSHIGLKSQQLLRLLLQRRPGHSQLPLRLALSHYLLTSLLRLRGLTSCINVLLRTSLLCVKGPQPTRTEHKCEVVERRLCVRKVQERQE